MKKIRFNIIIVIVLLIIATYFFITKKTSTIPAKLKDFAIEDTASVNKIFMVNKENQKVLLERKDGYWIVNKKFRVRNDGISMLLKTMKNLDVKAMVGKAAFKTIVENLAVKSIKVEIYQNDKLAKTYYVGGPTKDQYGTYMLLDKSSQPFIIQIKGFKGYLTPRYFIDEYLWRDRTLFNYKPSQIKSVTVILPKNPEASFKLFNFGNNTYGLEKGLKPEKAVQFDTLKVKQYLASFRRIGFFEFIKDINEEEKDSILASKPHYEITIEDINGITNKIKTFYRPNDGLEDSEGLPLKYDPDHEYAIWGENNDMILIQYFVFDPIFKELSYFKPKFKS
ncbi:MAG: DUF4340 domain-containing protein [Chlorobi bacterium]|nr:DUF4340 domain-containing protein [Chlorobiota bacterium]